ASVRLVPLPAIVWTLLSLCAGCHPSSMEAPTAAPASLPNPSPADLPTTAAGPNLISSAPAVTEEQSEFFPFEVLDLEVAGGAVVVAGPETVALVDASGPRWTVALQGPTAGFTIAGPCVLIGDGATLSCRQLDGVEAWSVPIPTGSVLDVAVHGEDAVLAMDDGELLRADLAVCAQGESCFTSAGKHGLRDPEIAVLADGSVLAVDGVGAQGARLISADGKALGTARGATSSVMGAPLLMAGSQLLRADPTCPQEVCFAPVRKMPDQGFMAPVEVPDVGIAYVDAYGVVELAKPDALGREWSVDAGVRSNLASDEQHWVFGVAVALEEIGAPPKSEPPRLVALSASNGAKGMNRKLGGTPANALEGFLVDASPVIVVAAVANELFMYPVPPPQR
ncbi:MAG: hypothetical protein ACPG4T_23215, partial [Nannocystaceae bacterium]